MAAEGRIAEILSDWLDRRGRGEPVTPEDAITAHPEFEDELRARFAAMDLLDRVLGMFPDAEPPEQVGEFRILREIGRGGMGVVYEAEQTTMGRRVALKILAPGVCGSPKRVRRFRREAIATGRLQHTNIVAVHSMGSEAGLLYYAMELIPGRPLSQLIEAMRDGEEPLGPRGTPEHRRRIAEMFAGVADGLTAAHRRRVIHRDVKPANLILDEHGTLKLMDFGLARVADERPAMTLTGEFLGTPLYMSPEQATAMQGVDHRTDIYSLGATLYEALALSPPFSGESFPEVYSLVVSEDPPPLRGIDSRIPRDLETIVLKAMEKRREDRYQDAGDMAKDLRRFADDVPVLARRVGLVGRTWRKARRHRLATGLSAALVLLAATGLFLGLRTVRESARRIDFEYTMLLKRAGMATFRIQEEESKRASTAARDLLGEAIALDPDRAEAWFARSLAPGATAEERLADIDAAVARGFPIRAARLARAFWYLEQGRKEEARAEERRAATLPRQGALDACFEGILLCEDGRWAEGIRGLTEAIRLSEPGSGGFLLAHHRRALAREREGDLDGALHDLSVVASWGDETLSTRVWTASLLNRMGRTEKAEELISTLIEEARAEGGEKPWLRLYGICEEIDEFFWKERAADEGLKRFPDSVPLLKARAKCTRMSRLPELIGVCDRIIELAPEDAEGYRIRGTLLGYESRIDEALRDLDRAIELDPLDSRNYRDKGATLSNIGRLDAARHALDRAAALDPRSWRIRSARIAIRMLRGDLEAALQDAREAVALRPVSSGPYAGLTFVLQYLDRYEEALEVCARGMKRFPRSPVLHFTKIRLLEWMGDHRAAREAIEWARQAFPDHHLIKWSDIPLLARTGRMEEAVSVIESGPDSLKYFKPALLDLEGRLAEANRLVETQIAEAEHLDPGWRIHSFLRRARNLVQLGHLDQGRSFLAEAARAGAEVQLTWPEEIEARLVLGDWENALSRCGLMRPQLARPNEHWFKVRSLRALGRCDEARRVAVSAADIRPPVYAELKYAYLRAVAGDRERATRLLEEYPFTWHPYEAYRRARVHSVLGEREAALEWLGKAVEKGCRWPVRKVPDPDFAPIRNDPRYEKLAKRLDPE